MLYCICLSYTKVQQCRTIEAEHWWNWLKSNRRRAQIKWEFIFIWNVLVLVPVLNAERNAHNIYFNERVHKFTVSARPHSNRYTIIYFSSTKITGQKKKRRIFVEKKKEILRAMWKLKSSISPLYCDCHCLLWSARAAYSDALFAHLCMIDLFLSCYYLCNKHTRKRDRESRPTVFIALLLKVRVLPLAIDSMQIWFQ